MPQSVHVLTLELLLFFIVYLNHGLWAGTVPHIALVVKFAYSIDENTAGDAQGVLFNVI